MAFRAVFFLFLLALPAIAGETDPVLATVGNRKIRKSEFVSRYELTPAFQRNVGGMKDYDKTAFLVSLIAEKLMAAEAAEEGIPSDSDYQSAIKDVERLLTRDELYQREVRQKVMINDGEIRDAMKKEGIDVKVYFLYAATKEGAEFLELRIARGERLEDISFVHDSTGEFEGPDSAIARWGEMDERMERVIYALPLGATSSPILLDDGYYIVKIMGNSVTVAGGEREKSGLRERAEQTLRRRRELRRMFEYIDDVLKGKEAQARSHIFRVVTGVLQDIADEDLSNDTTGTFILGPADLSTLRARVPDLWDSSFVVLGGERWTLAETMSRVLESRFTVDRPISLRSFRAAFNDRIRDLINQEQLTLEAYRQKLNLSSAVRNDLAVWQDSYLAGFLRKRFLDTVAVSSTECDAYLATVKADSLQRILVKVRYILVDSLRTARAIENDLARGVPFIREMIEKTTDEASLTRIGKEEFAAVASLGPFAHVALALEPGEHSRPVATSRGYAIVEMIEKREKALDVTDTTGAELRRSVAASKLEGYLTKTLGKLADTYGVTVDAEALKAVEVTSIPSLVYRFVGFGGRMFAAPFVSPEVEWINAWRPKGFQLP